jgi:hypothetical protein
VFLASTLGIPIVVMGLGYDRPKRVGTWDRFAIPRPFSRARGIVSRAISVPPDLDRDGIERYRAAIERLLTHLSDEAEAWATAGSRRPNQRSVRKEPSRVARRTAVLKGEPGVELDAELARAGLPAADDAVRDRPAA